MSETKMWGKEEFWGLGFEWDPQWLLSAEQKELQAKLIALCETTLRANAVESDANYVYPRKNFEALATLGLLSLIVPKELGGLGQNHVCAAMVVETIARYGCPSTAMCYTMHLGAVAAALLRHHENPLLTDILKRLDKDVLIGTLSYSDPETGSHFWYPISSKAEAHGDGWKVTKKASWTTSGGFADWYIVQTTSPGFSGDYSDLSCFLVTKDEVKANPSEWDGLGLRGNQSGPIVVENAVLPKEALVGPIGVTVNSFSSVSLDPPLILFSMARSLHSLARLEKVKAYSVNILMESQQDISNRFARTGEDKFSATPWEIGPSGAPRLVPAHAIFECVPYAHYDGGDHVIFVGRVVHLHAEGEGDPLLYYRGSYRLLAAIAQEG